MTTGLLEPRLYRAAFIPSLFALVLLMFSLEARPPAYPPGLQPPPFAGARVAAVADQLQERYGAREAGSASDADLAKELVRRLAAQDFVVHSYPFSARTVRGRKDLVNVVAVRPGLSDRRIVVVASRDGIANAYAGVGSYETAALLELARVLEGRSLRHTLVLASLDAGVSGSAGASELARHLKGPVDAVLAMRNLPGSRTIDAPALAAADERMAPDTRLVRTADAAYRVELRRSTGQRSIPAQLVLMGFPLALGEQAAFIGQQRAAVAFSPAGEPLVVPSAGGAVASGSSGRAVLRTLLALDSRNVSQGLERPSIVIGDKRIPGWPLTLLIGMLVLPLLVVAVDSWARARRRHESSVRGVAAPVVALVPLLVAAFALRGLGTAGVIDAPALPPDPAAFDGGIAVWLGIAFAVAVLVACLAVARLSAHAATGGGEAGIALWLAFAALAAFALNPVATAFALPVLHTAMLLLLGSEEPRTGRVLLAATLSSLPLLLAGLYFPFALDMGVGQTIWFGTSLLAGGFISPPALVVESAVVAGLVAAFGMVAGRARVAGGLESTLGPAFSHGPVVRG